MGAATITSITWKGLRCFVEANISGIGVVVDLCLERPSGESVVASAKAVDSDGSVSLVLADDEYEGAQFVLVLRDDAGSILDHQSTKVGVDS